MSAARPLPPKADAGGIAEPWRDRLGLLLESTAEGIYGIDLEGRCMFANAAAARLLGWTAAALIGQNMHALIHHHHADGRPYPEADCPIVQAFRAGRPCRVDDEVLWRADGSPFWAEYTSHPILGEQGEVLGAVITFLDISPRKLADAALREARDGLELRVADRTAELSRALDQLRELSAHLETVREEERTRIAREIHDELGSLLVALKMDTDWLARRLEDRPLLSAKCHGMGTLIDTAVDNVGRIITDLRPSILDHQGLWAALEWQAQEFVEAAELKGDVQLHVTHGVQPPQGERAIAVFRIFQEALSNIARHAKATQVRIRVEVDAPPEPVLYIDVRDDGVGAAPQDLNAPDAWGVMGMRERAARFGGRLSLDSKPGQGTHLRLTMPLEDDPPA